MKLNWPSTRKNTERQRGVALLMVLFVVSLLMIIAAEFTFTTRMEITTAQNFKEDVQGYYYALAGFQYALTEVLGEYDENYVTGDGQVGFYRKWYEESTNPQPAEGEEAVTTEWPPLPTRNGILIGDGAFDYIITDEEGKLNLNYLNARSGRGSSNNRDVFRQVLIQTGVEEGELPDVIIDSIMDWIDRNDEHRLNGAETDWYERNYKEQGFMEPYTAKNGKLDTIDELLMIRGMTPEILFGSDSIYAMQQDEEGQYRGILPYVTVYGYHRKVNENTAAPLLLAIIDPDNVDQKLDDRQSRDQKKRKTKSRTFRIEVRGYYQTSNVNHNLMAVVRRAYGSKSGSSAEIYYWNDDAMTFGAELNSFVDESGTEMGK